MSTYSQTYGDAAAELKRKLRMPAFLLLAGVVCVLAAGFVWKPAGTPAIFLIIAAVAIAFSKWKRRVWRDLEGKYGLR